MSAVRALVLQAPGTNCDLETADALTRAGADVSLVPAARLFAAPERILEARILFFPGGFAHGDDVAAARILANQCRLHLGGTLARFVDEEGGFVVGICNGFQTLVKMGLLPRAGGRLAQEATLTYNLSGRYECRWVRLRIEDSPCPFLPSGEIWELPVGHAEGRVVLGPALPEDGGPFCALRYADADGRPAARYPDNPNGSTAAIAGLTDASGRVLGLMPHPDRAYLPHHHPRRARGTAPHPPHGLRFFQNLVEAARAH